MAEPASEGPRPRSDEVWTSSRFARTSGSCHRDDPVSPEDLSGRRFLGLLAAHVWIVPGTKVVVPISEDGSRAAPFLLDSTTKSKGRGKGKEEGDYSVTTCYVEKNAPAFATQRRTVTTSQGGAWQVEFEPMVAGFTPKFIVATAGAEGNQGAGRSHQRRPRRHARPASPSSSPQISNIQVWRAASASDSAWRPPSSCCRRR